MSLSTEQLLLAIRKADSIEQLKRLIGPSEADKVEASIRLNHLDNLWAKAEQNGWGYEPKNWPYPFNESYQRIHQEQTDYENQYC